MLHCYIQLFCQDGTKVLEMNLRFDSTAARINVYLHIRHSSISNAPWYHESKLERVESSKRIHHNRGPNFYLFMGARRGPTVLPPQVRISIEYLRSENGVSAPWPWWVNMRLLCHKWLPTPFSDSTCSRSCVSSFLDEPYCPYNSMLSRCQSRLELRHYVRRANRALENRA